MPPCKRKKSLGKKGSGAYAGVRRGFPPSSFIWLRSFLSGLLTEAMQFTKRGNMRSELVYSASEKVQNRFLLATLTIRAVRRLHIISTRTEDTANKVLSELADGNFLEVKTPELKPMPPIDILSITPAA